MKTYKLLKDLPTWKAGTEFWIGEDECLYGLSEEGKPIMVYHAITLINFDLLKNGEWLEEIKETKSVWELKEGDKYYFLGCNECIYDYWRDSNADRQIRDIGNCFLTQEEAQKELQKRKAIQKIKKWCWENGIDTDYEEERNSKLFYIEIDGEFEGQINFDSFEPVFSPIGYFSHENAQKILENFEEELKIILE